MRKLKGNRKDNESQDALQGQPSLLVVCSLVVIIQLTNFASYLANLPPLQAVLGVQYDPVLLLELP